MELVLDVFELDVLVLRADARFHQEAGPRVFDWTTVVFPLSFMSVSPEWFIAQSWDSEGSLISTFDLLHSFHEADVERPRFSKRRVPCNCPRHTMFVPDS